MRITSNTLNAHDQYRRGGLTQRITTYGSFAGHHPVSSPKKPRRKGRRGRKQDVIKGGRRRKGRKAKGTVCVRRYLERRNATIVMNRCTMRTGYRGTRNYRFGDANKLAGRYL